MRLADRGSILVDLALPFAVMVSVKWLADSAEIVGAGSIAIWSAIIVATWRMRRRDVAWRDLGLALPRGRRAWVMTVLLALLGVVSTFAMFVGLDFLLAKLGLEDAGDAPDRWTFFLGKPEVFFAYLIAVVWIGAALGEELLMRGFVLNRLAALFGRSRLGWTAALGVHAVIFGSMHAYQGWAGIIGTGFVALGFGTIYLLAGRRLAPVILAHGIVNTIGLTAYYLSDGTVQ